MPQHSNITSLVVKFDTRHDRHSFGDGVAGLLTRFNNLRYLCLQLDEVPGCIKKVSNKLHSCAKKKTNYTKADRASFMLSFSI